MTSFDNMDNLLPFETTKRSVYVRKQFKTSDKFGKLPGKRTVDELINLGVVNVDKPAGPTSHQVSAYVQKILGIKKSGHSGTLDPNVTGVLPVALKKSTKVIQTLLKAGKEYVCLMHLHKPVKEYDLYKALEKFTGKINQLPPIKSSVKRQLRERTVYYIDVLSIQDQDVLFKVGCEAGTYVRKLCLHPNTQILTNEGLMSASDYYFNPKRIYSFNKGKMIEKNPSATQKIQSPEKLVKITMSSGVHIIITPDHELLTSTIDGYKMKKASEIKKTDYLVKSLNFPHKSKQISISDLLDDDYLIQQKNIKKECKNAFISKYGSIRAMNRALKLDRKAFLSKSDHAITIKHLKLAGIYNKIKKEIHTFKTQKGSLITLKKLNEDLFYLFGLIASDGNNTKEKGTVRHTRIKFHNKNEVLIDQFLKIYKKLFPNIPISKTKMTPTLFQLDTTNSFLATIAASFGIKSPQKYSDLLPIVNANSNLIKSFLRGYFDGDGSAYFKKTRTNHKTKICLHTISSQESVRLHMMLLKVGIPNKIFTRRVNSKLVSKGKEEKMYEVAIGNISSEKKFIKEIGTNHPEKAKKFEKILSLKNARRSCDHYKKYIKEKKSLLHAMGGNLSRISKEKIPITRGFYKKASTMCKLPELDDFIIEKIKSIESVVGTDYVYDMTVPKTHNFLIETGFVSSNCHDIGQELKIGAHMAELRRTKAGPFNETTLFTLQDLTDALYYYKKHHNEKFIRKVIQPVEAAVDHLPKIWVFDTTVDSLCHGASLAVPGISKLETGIKKNELVAIFTLKNELICYGESLLTSKQMMADKGLAVKTDKVVMDREVYPRIK